MQCEIVANRCFAEANLNFNYSNGLEATESKRGKEPEERFNAAAGQPDMSFKRRGSVNGLHEKLQLPKQAEQPEIFRYKQRDS